MDRTGRPEDARMPGPARQRFRTKGKTGLSGQRARAGPGTDGCVCGTRAIDFRNGKATLICTHTTGDPRLGLVSCTGTVEVRLRWTKGEVRVTKARTCMFFYG